MVSCVAEAADQRHMNCCGATSHSVFANVVLCQTKAEHQAMEARARQLISGEPIDWS